MSLRHPMAAIKETAKQKTREIVVGQAASLATELAVRQLSLGGDPAEIHLKRNPRQGWMGSFLPAVGQEVELRLHERGFTGIHFDADASALASKEPVHVGYGNPAVMDWRKDVVAFVFAEEVEMAEVHQLVPQTGAVEQEFVVAA